MDFDRVADPKKYTDDSMPTYPARFLTQHCVIKGVQLGSSVGILVFPLVSIFRKISFSGAWKVTMPASATVGVAISLGLLYYKHSTGALDADGVDDRAYRIKHNEGQNKVDFYSGVGAVAGGALGVLGSRSVLSSAIAGSLTGVALGIGAYGAEKNPQVKEQLDDLKSKLKSYFNSSK